MRITIHVTCHNTTCTTQLLTPDTNKYKDKYRER